MMIFTKLKLGFFSIVGYIYKLLVDIKLLNVPDLKPENGVDVIVSLTSYGRRVRSNVVYYTLVSLLRQKLQPAQIVLWLADSEWNEMTIPQKLKSLEAKGVEICYCKDIRSYKKLIPTLVKYPDKTIVTVDDDMIYSSDTLETLWVAHDKNPNEIVCTVARKPSLENGLIGRYNDWEDSLIHPFKNEIQGYDLFPVGVGGVLYPVGSLHDDVVKEDLFMTFCPYADDIWFWFCGWRKHTAKRYVQKKGNDVSFDSLYQYFHKGSALTHKNSQEDQNDIQIRNLFKHYHIGD